jgi:hypothetical protein
MKVKETIDDLEFKEFLAEEKFSDERIKASVEKIEKGLNVGKDGRYAKIGKIEGEKYSPKVQGSKKSYNELANKATSIRKGLLLGAYIGKSKEEKRKNIPSRLTQLRNITNKMRFHKNIVNKMASKESSKKEHEVAMAKLREPTTKKLAKEKWEKKEAKRQVKGAKAKRKSDWEKRVKSHVEKTRSLADFKE